MNQSINQSISQSTNQSVNQSINQSSDQPINQSINHAINQSSRQSKNQCMSGSMKEQRKDGINGIVRNFFVEALTDRGPAPRKHRPYLRDAAQATIPYPRSWTVVIYCFTSRLLNDVVDMLTWLT